MSAGHTATGVQRILANVLAEDDYRDLPFEIAEHSPTGEVDRERMRIWVEENDLIKANVRRAAHVSEGDDSPILQIDAHMNTPAENAGIMRQWLETPRALMRQDLDIISEGYDPERPPARFHTCHPLLAEAIRLWGWDAEEVVKPTTIHIGNGLVIARMENGLFTDMMQKEVEGGRAILTRRLLRRRVIVDSLIVIPATSSDGSGPRVLFSEQDGMAMVSISSMVLPESALVAIRGRKVGEILDGGALRAFAGFTVEDVLEGSGGGMTTLVIAPGDVPLV